MHIISDTVFGFPDYIMCMVDTGDFKTMHKHEIYPLEGLGDAFDDNDDAFASDPHLYYTQTEFELELNDPEDGFSELPTIEPPKKRFAVLESRIDLENMADERNAPQTKSQTRWAVKIFKG